MNEKLSKQLIKFRDLSKSVADAFQLYVNKLEYTGFSGFEPYLSEEIINNIKYVSQSTILSSYNKNNKLKMEDIFDIYSEIMTHYQKLHKTLEILQNNRVNLSKQGSYTSSGSTLTLTYIKDLNETYEKIYYIFQSYKTEIQSLSLIHAILDEFNDKSLQNISIKEIENLNNIYFIYVNKNQGDLVIEIYINILHKIIIDNTGTQPGKEIIKYVNKSVEKIKSQVLDTEDILDDHNKLTNTVQNLIQMHNLVPDSMSIPLSELLTILGIETSDYDFDKISKTISKDKKFGFIIINKIIKNPLEYNLWTLFSKEYLENKKLLQPVEVGLNSVILERCKTIIPMTNNDLTNIPKDIIEIYNKEFENKETDSNFYYVIETLDGKNYRFLTPWNVDRNKHISVYHIPSSWLDNIDNKKISPSKRIESYNNIINQEITKSLQKPYVTMELMNREEVQKEETYWNTLRNRIKILILEDFVNLFTEKFMNNENKEKITSDKISKLILNDNLYKSALNHITENIELDNVGNISNLGNQFQIELTLSYFYDLSNIQRTFKKDVDNIYKKEYQKKILTILSENKLFLIKNKLSEIYSLILDEILEKFINRKSGIYLSIQKKFTILNKTLLSR